jgi:hypothetical protein
MSTKGKTSTYDVLSNSEDELDWEEVTVPQAQHRARRGTINETQH